MPDQVQIVRDRGGYDYEVLSTPLVGAREFNETMSYLLKNGYKISELDLMYVESGRHASWVYPAREDRD